MEIQLQELIDKIKNDGVKVAEVEAEAILKNAKAEAEKIIADAKTTADKIVSDSKNESMRMVRASEDAIRQAGRNLLISFRESVARELDAIIGEKVDAVYSSQLLEKIIVDVVEKWSSVPETQSLTVILNSDDVERLERALASALKERIRKGVILKANDNFTEGFRIAVNDGAVFYDYSKEAVVEMLSNYLSPKVTKLMKEAE